MLENNKLGRIETVIQGQRRYFNSGITKNLEYRVAALKRLKASIEKHVDDISEALYKDLGKNETEGYMMETGFVLKSISQTIKLIPKWAKDEPVPRTITSPLSKAIVRREPYGNVLIIAPFNYPFQLIMEPLIAAISSGNTAVIKASSLTPNTNNVVSKIIKESFRWEHVYFLNNTPRINEEVLDSTYDMIFFTGSMDTGKKIMAKAASTLTPIILELGGRNPAIIMKDANIEVAARKIVWGKFSNCGQTCIAPNHVLVHEEIYESFIFEAKKSISSFYGKDAKRSPSYGRLISEEAFDRIMFALSKSRGTLTFGGDSDRSSKYIEPTIVRDVTWEDELLKNEIFGPVLPVIKYKNINEEIEIIKKMDKPLAVYVFTENIENGEKVVNKKSFGGGCINETLLHVSNPELPFGGVGHSGMGKYHGKAGFDAFSNKKSLLISDSKFEMKLIYPPYTKLKSILIKKMLK